MRSIVRRLAARLVRDRRAVSLIEFALIMPLFLVFTLSGLEMTNLMIITGKVQRLASTTADLTAQRGTSPGMVGAPTDRRLTELQMYDILDAANISARPIDFARDGRLVISAVVGEDTGTDGIADVNRIKWQRFGGGYTAAPLLLGCWRNSTTATLRGNRRLVLDEAMFHSQVTVRYRPIIDVPLLTWFGAPRTITRTATLRGRGGTFRAIASVDGYTPKDRCDA
jgi:hypothetical protein